MLISMFLFLLLILPVIALLLYYLTVLILASIPRKNTSKQGIGGKSKFSLEIFIPIREEPAEIVKNTLQENKQAYDSSSCVKRITILSDDTEDYFQTLKSELEPTGKVNVVRREAPHGGRTGALDYYFSTSNSDYVLVLDVDGRIDRKSLEHLCGSLDGHVAYVLPWKGYYLEKTRVAEAMSFFTDLGSLILYKLRWKAGFFIFPLGSGTAYNRSIVVSLGGWGDNVIQDDIYMGVKLASKGYKPILVGDGEVRVLVPSKLYALRKQQSRWAYGTSEVLSRNFKEILKAPLPWRVKLEMIAYMLQPLETLPPFTAFVLSPVVALIDKPILPVHAQIFNITSIFTLMVVLSFAEGILAFNVERGFLKGKLRDYLINLGRFSAILTVLSPHLSIAAIKGLMRKGLRWEVTPKGEKEKRVPKDRTPLFLISWSILGVVASLYTSNLYTLLVSLSFLIASTYSLLRLEL